MSTGDSPKPAGIVSAALTSSLFAGLADAALPMLNRSPRSRHGSQENPIFLQYWDVWTIGGKSKDEPDWVPALPSFQCLVGYCSVMPQEYSTAGVVGVRDGVIETNCGFYRLGDPSAALVKLHNNEGYEAPTAEEMLQWLAKEVQ